MRESSKKGNTREMVRRENYLWFIIIPLFNNPAHYLIFKACSSVLTEEHMRKSCKMLKTTEKI